MKYLRKSVYQCRAPYCRHNNIVYQWVDGENQVLETAPGWRHQCAACNRSSFDLRYQKAFEPEKRFSPSVDRDGHRHQGIHPAIQE